MKYAGLELEMLYASAVYIRSHVLRPELSLTLRPAISVCSSFARLLFIL